MHLSLKFRFTGIATLLLTLGSAAFAQLPSPVLPDQTTRVSEHVQMITSFPNIFFVTGEDAILVVDTGLGIEQGETVARVAERLAPGLKLYLTTTHFHPEHAAGELGFPEGTTLIRAARQHEEMERDGLTMVNLFRGFGNFGPLLEGVDGMRQPDIIFDDDMVLDLGGVTVRMMWLGIAHTEGDELIFVETDSVLISGDIVQNKVVPTVSSEGGSLTNWINIMSILEQLDANTVAPTHSRIGDGSLVSESRAFMIDMRSRALALKGSGMSVEDAGTQLTQEFQDDYPLWASNTDWNNVQGIPGFVQRVYLEADAMQ